MAFLSLHGADEDAASGIVGRHRRVAGIVSPEVEGIAGFGEKLDQIDRILHMIKHAGSDDEIVAFIRMLKPFDEVAKKEFRALQVEKLLDDETAKK